MKSKTEYEIPIFSSALESNPIIECDGMDVKIRLIGADDRNRLRKIMIRFKTVLCNKYTLACFTPKLYDSFDKIVELKDSEWLKELENINREEFKLWKPKHYVLYLDDIGMLQFIAKDYEVMEYE